MGLWCLTSGCKFQVLALEARSAALAFVSAGIKKAPRPEPLAWAPGQMEVGPPLSPWVTSDRGGSRGRRQGCWMTTSSSCSTSSSSGISWRLVVPPGARRWCHTLGGCAGLWRQWCQPLSRRPYGCPHRTGSPPCRRRSGPPPGPPRAGQPRAPIPYGTPPSARSATAAGEEDAMTRRGNERI